MNRSPAFAEAIARARTESAHGLAMEALDIADSAGPENNPQLIKNRCDLRRWLAGKYNALRTSWQSPTATVARSPRGSRMMSAAERSAWAAEVAAQARALLAAPTIDHEDP
jgi:hypothetical protein